MRCESSQPSRLARLIYVIVVGALLGLPTARAGEPERPLAAAIRIEDQPSSSELLAELQSIRAQLDRIEKRLQESVPPAGQTPSRPATSLIVEGLKIHHDTPVARLANGKTVPLGNGHHIFRELPKSVAGRNYTVRDGYQGKLQFDVLETQTVFLALYGKDWGGGGNPSGDWQHEVVTRQQLEQQGWKQMDQLAVQHSNPEYQEEPSWLLFVRNCEAGESFLVRNHKYQAPILIWGLPAAE